MADHYFTPAPTAASRPSAVQLDLPDVSLLLGTDRGVFAAGGVDPGTKYLLMEAPAPPPTGNLLDLGCGYGPVACVMGLRSPDATVWGVDINERAVALCAANATANGLTNVRAVDPASVPADLRFDAIWSNPPIRVGKAALHDLLTTWLDRLTPQGHALLVVQKHLGADSLHRWLESQGFATRRLGSRQAYRLLDVAARDAAPGPT